MPQYGIRNAPHLGPAYSAEAAATYDYEPDIQFFTEFHDLVSGQTELQMALDRNSCLGL